MKQKYLDTDIKGFQTSPLFKTNWYQRVIYRIYKRFVGLPYIPFISNVKIVFELQHGSDFGKIKMVTVNDNERTEFSLINDFGAEFFPNSIQESLIWQREIVNPISKK